ncbi:N-acylglucosamine 2-epimerase [Streptomyces sp. V4I23]|uniref:AGE family epimerase/isomerase n=1 Tax=Streptomyces sp. V4I23 TaxID=3042282 RepID=UPI0027846015|nr:AGE family epimerase/isomerase [Streptomyces sp. V4I23]MDQ1007067.1 N-acylglucosamine 2-epimerase [Streptomyces sp. V4I23]
MTSAAREQLERVVLPYWLERGPDAERGGFHTCYDNRGRSLVSTDKFTWSQGRLVWLLARAARMARSGLLDVDACLLEGLAVRGAQFLVDHAIRPDGTCHFVVDADGVPKRGPTGETQSVYADCFVVMGLAELAGATASPSWLDIAEPVLRRATADITAGRAATPPYAVPAGHTAFGPRMILLNTRLEHAHALARLGLLTDRDVAALSAARTAMLSHRNPDGTFTEIVSPKARDTSLVARHRVPGHAIEGIWVALEATELTGDQDDVPELLESVDVLCRSAWDPQHGGLFRYVDAEGPVAPRGTTTGTAYEDLVTATWDTKLWWVHTEAAYTTALGARRYGDGACADWAERIWDYTVATFPGRNEGEEWIQIRDRAGRPLDRVVALPVKDPFHIARNLMQLVELYGTAGERR